MVKIKVRRQQKKRIYIHNDLSNAAFYFMKRIESRLQNNDQEGIAFDHMAFLILSAFAFEARINFLGKKLITNWREITISRQGRQRLLSRRNQATIESKTFFDLKDYKRLPRHSRSWQTKRNDIGRRSHYRTTGGRRAGGSHGRVEKILHAGAYADRP